MDLFSLSLEPCSPPFLPILSRFPLRPSAGKCGLRKRPPSTGASPPIFFFSTSPMAPCFFSDAYLWHAPESRPYDDSFFLTKKPFFKPQKRAISFSLSLFDLFRMGSRVSYLEEALPLCIRLRDTFCLLEESPRLFFFLRIAQVQFQGKCVSYVMQCLNMIGCLNFFYGTVLSFSLSNVPLDFYFQPFLKVILSLRYDCGPRVEGEILTGTNLLSPFFFIVTC